RLLRPIHSDVVVPVSHRKLDDDAENFTGIDGLAFLDLDALDRYTFRRADFVLHLHRFHDQQTLIRFHFFTCPNQHANHLAGHGRDDLLTAFRLHAAVPSSPPRAGINDFGGEFESAAL